MRCECAVVVQIFWFAQMELWRSRANLKGSAENADGSDLHAKNYIYSSVFLFTLTIDASGMDLSLLVSLKIQSDTQSVNHTASHGWWPAAIHIALYNDNPLELLS